MSQCSQILKHLQKRPITAIQALQLYECFRLAARIKDLRESGFDINTQMIERDGKRFARYSLQTKT